MKANILDPAGWETGCCLSSRSHGGTHLVQCCLGNRVVLDAEPLFIGHHQLKYPGQGGGGDLVLQRVVVLLPLDAAGEGALHEALHGLQVRGRARFSCLDLHGHYVAFAESV